MSKPAIIFVHGAWNPPEQYLKLTNPLKEAGYEVFAPRLVTVGNKAAGKTWKDDAAVIMEVLQPLVDGGREVVVVAHSYGGIPTPHAISGFEIKEGKAGGVKAAVYIAAFCLQKGVDLYTATGQNYLACVRKAEPYSGNFILTLDDGAAAAFFNDVTEEEAQAAMKLLEGQSQDSFETAITVGPADLAIPSTYVICEKDGALPLFLQETLCSGMKVERINAGHFPFFAEQDRVVDIIRQVADA